MYEVLINDEWVQVEKPENGQQFKFTDAAGGVINSFFYAPTLEENTDNQSN